MWITFSKSASCRRNEPGRSRQTFRPTLEILEGRLALSFTAAPAVAVGDEPATVVTADFNRDGNPDFAVTTPGSKTVSVRLGDGLGGFVAVPDITKSVWTSGPLSLAVGHFNNDDIPDLVLGYRYTSFGTDNGWTGSFLGNGQGGFNSSTEFAYAGSDPRSLAVADFDQAVAGLEYASASPSAKSFYIYFGSITSTGSAIPHFVAAGDFNRDGKQDLAVAVDVGTQGEVWVYPGDGTGELGTPVRLAVAPQPRSIAVGDFDGDGLLDLAVASVTVGTNSVTLWRGLGTGIFVQAPAVDIFTRQFSIVAADFNRDGKLDFATADNFNAQVLVRLGNGDLTFTSIPAVPSGSSPVSLAVADFNRDSMPDLAVANFSRDTVTVLLNRFPVPPPPPVVAQPIVATLVTRKVGKTQRLFVLVSFADTGALKAELRSPFQKPGFRAIAATVIDSNGDGIPDAVEVSALKIGSRRRRVRRAFVV